MEFNKTVADPNLSDLLALFKRDIMLSINCHAIATVQSFNPENQTVTATINYKKTAFQVNQSGAYVSSLSDYAQLVDCPVIVLGGGPASLSFPIRQGDECLILFNDRDIDNWFNGGPPIGVNTPVLHSFSDAIALVGLRSKPNALSDYDSQNVVLRNGTTLVSIGESLIKIANSTTTLNTLLQSLISTLQGLTTINCVPGSPVTLSPATITALANVATQIGELLL